MIHFFQPKTFAQPNFIEILRKINELLNYAAEIAVLHLPKDEDCWRTTKFLVFLTDQQQLDNVYQKLIHLMTASDGLNKYRSHLKNAVFKIEEPKKFEPNYVELEKIFHDINHYVAVYLHGLLFLAFSFDASKEMIFDEHAANHFLSNEIFRQLTLQGLYKEPSIKGITEQQHNLLGLSLLEEKLEQMHQIYVIQLQNSRPRYI